MATIASLWALLGLKTDDFELGVKKSRGLMGDLNREFGNRSPLGKFGRILKGGGAVIGLYALGEAAKQLREGIVRVREVTESSHHAWNDYVAAIALSTPVVGGVVNEIAKFFAELGHPGFTKEFERSKVILKEMLELSARAASIRERLELAQTSTGPERADVSYSHALAHAKEAYEARMANKEIRENILLRSEATRVYESELALAHLAHEEELDRLDAIKMARAVQVHDRIAEIDRALKIQNAQTGAHRDAVQARMDRDRAYYDALRRYQDAMDTAGIWEDERLANETRAEALRLLEKERKLANLRYSEEIAALEKIKELKLPPAYEAGTREAYSIIARVQANPGQQAMSQVASQSKQACRYLGAILSAIQKQGQPLVVDLRP